LERGDIVWATDPLSEKGRPMLVLGTPRFPNHGVQLITVLISTRTYHEAGLTLRDEDYEGDPLGERSHVLPWSLVTLDSAADVDHYLTSLVDDRTEDVTSQVIDYISS
jgi:mRNA-degrading endonuclease toxin of MazEF toxin-antitoxin module